MKITVLIFVIFFGLFCELHGEKKSPDRPGKGKNYLFFVQKSICNSKFLTLLNKTQNICFIQYSASLALSNLEILDAQAKCLLRKNIFELINTL